MRVAPMFVAAGCMALGAVASEAAAKVNYGPISHKGLKKVGATSTSIKLGLQIGLVAQGSNALFGGSCCPARPGFDLATGLGSPIASQVAALLASRG